MKYLIIMIIYLKSLKKTPSKSYFWFRWRGSQADFDNIMRINVFYGDWGAKILTDIHMHESRYSSDSFVFLEEIVAKAKYIGLDGICITDHESNQIKAE